MTWTNFLAVCCLTLLPLSGQIGPGVKVPAPKTAAAPEDDTPAIKVDVNLANVLFAVRDKKNGLIGNLNKDDFTLHEDGKQQTILSFTRETDLPLTLGLLIDVSGSQQNLIDIERSAASQFFSQVIRTKDLAFLISFGSEAELLQDYTSSPKLLRAGLDGLRVNVSTVGLGAHPGPVPTASQPRGTILYDTVVLAAKEKLRGEVGRKALVLITDGVDQGSRATLNGAIEAAQKADAIIYSIYYVDPSAYGFGVFGGGSDGSLRKLSEETGGRVLRVDRRNSLEDILRQIQAELRSQYAISYVSSNSARDGAFRRIEIKTSNRELKVQARKGYFAAADKD